MTTLEQPATIRPYESAMYVPWQEINPAKMQELRDFVSTKGLHLPDPLVAMRGGGMIAPSPKELAPGYKKFLTSERSIAIVPVKTEPGGKLEQVIRFPSKKESLPFDANVTTYRSLVGDYLHQHRDTNTPSTNPFPETMGIEKLADGRFVSSERYRPYLRGLGKGAGTLGIHELDTRRISPDQARELVHVLATAHPNASEFYDWASTTEQTIPEESFLHPGNPLHALRGQEWWIDRVDELKTKAHPLKKHFAAIDPAFDVDKAIETVITNNLDVFPHQNGATDHAEVEKSLVVTHGTLYPDNIHANTDRDGNIRYTITGGDRAQGKGLPGQMIDWLVTASAESPAHQYALIDEFMKLYPGEINRRGLAMHVLYRSLMESGWFASGKKPAELQNLTKLSYDILSGNGIWEGVNIKAKL